jgi:CheY-like chemotaxis protein
MKFERSIGQDKAAPFDSLADARAWLIEELGAGGDTDDCAGAAGVGRPDMPVHAGAEAEEQPAEAERRGRPRIIDGRILYVEDNFRIAEITEMMLDDLGMVVTWAACAEDALKIIDAAVEPFDIVLTDIVMPGMSGVQLARRIGHHWADVPVVLTSGFSEELAQGYGSEYELLQKPFTRVALIECLQRYLGLPKP